MEVPRSGWKQSGRTLEIWDRRVIRAATTRTSHTFLPLLPPRNTHYRLITFTPRHRRRQTAAPVGGADTTSVLIKLRRVLPLHTASSATMMISTIPPVLVTSSGGGGGGERTPQLSELLLHHYALPRGMNLPPQSPTGDTVDIREPLAFPQCSTLS